MLVVDANDLLDSKDFQHVCDGPRCDVEGVDSLLARGGKGRASTFDLSKVITNLVSAGIPRRAPSKPISCALGLQQLPDDKQSESAAVLPLARNEEGLEKSRAPPGWGRHLDPCP